MVHQPFIFSPTMEKKRVRARVRMKKESFLHDGLIDSFTSPEEFKKFGDEQNHFRDFSLQTLIKADAVELLKPLGTLPYDVLRSADVLTSAVGSFDNLYQVAAEKIADFKSAESSAIKSDVNNG